MIFHTGWRTQSWIVNFSKKWKKEKTNFAFDVHSTRTNRCSSTNFLRFSMPRRVVTIQKKFRIIKQFRSYQTLDEIYLRFEESLRGKRKKKWRKRKIRAKNINNHRLFLLSCRHLRVHARVCFQTAATTIIDGEWWTVNNHTIVSARGGVIFERLESLQLHSD